MSDELPRPFDMGVPPDETMNLFHTSWLHYQAKIIICNEYILELV